jgi:hypothetical protein
MDRLSQWNWDTSVKEIPLTPRQTQFEWIEEYQASPDGESVAAIVKAGEGAFNMWSTGRPGRTASTRCGTALFSRRPADCHCVQGR